MPRTKTDSRERILDVATDLFFRQGYQSTSVDEIIEQCGLSKPTVYSYFPSKEILCVEYLKKRRKDVIQELRSAIRAGKSPEERFLATIHYVRGGMLSTSYRGCGFFNMVAEVPDPENPVVQESREFVERFCEEIREAILDLKENHPDFADIDVDRVTTSYHLIVCGAIMMGQEIREPWVLDRAVEDVERLLESLR